MACGTLDFVPLLQAVHNPLRSPDGLPAATANPFGGSAFPQHGARAPQLSPPQSHPSSSPRPDLSAGSAWEAEQQLAQLLRQQSHPAQDAAHQPHAAHRQQHQQFAYAGIHHHAAAPSPWQSSTQPAAPRSQQAQAPGGAHQHWPAGHQPRSQPLPSADGARGRGGTTAQGQQQPTWESFVAYSSGNPLQQPAAQQAPQPQSQHSQRSSAGGTYTPRGPGSGAHPGGAVAGTQLPVSDLCGAGDFGLVPSGGVIDTFNPGEESGGFTEADLALLASHCDAMGLHPSDLPSLDISDDFMNMQQG